MTTRGGFYASPVAQLASPNPAIRRPQRPRPEPVFASITVSMTSPPRSHVSNLESRSICVAEAMDLLLLCLPMANSTENIAVRPEKFNCASPHPGVLGDLHEDDRNFQ